MDGDWEWRCHLDVETVDCPICTDHLTPPVYQCENGHIICSTCCENLDRKTCPSCTQPTGRIRCLAVEKILESLLVPCEHGPYGCKQMLPFCKSADREDHEKRTCKFQPFPCPIPSCSHEGPLARFAAHFTEDHGVTRSEWDIVSGGPCVKLRMSSKADVRMLDLAGGLMLVHLEERSDVGDVFGCNAYGVSVTCKLKVKRLADASSSYKMKAPVRDWSLRSERESCSLNHLVVPVEDESLPRHYDLTVCIGYPEAAPDRQALADTNPPPILASRDLGHRHPARGRHWRRRQGSAAKRAESGSPPQTGNRHCYEF